MSSMPMPSSAMPLSLGAPEADEIHVPSPPLRVAIGGLALAVAALFLIGVATFRPSAPPPPRAKTSSRG
jgi:hypothetical protein